MTDKSSHSSSSKKSAKSIKEKRAEKKAGETRTGAQDPIAHITKR
jgi:hypothetical protein